ncbi:MAG: histidinol dehydrogenase, partial [Candidatus Altiarchaeales archaeon WOR_SM1_79]
MRIIKYGDKKIEEIFNARREGLEEAAKAAERILNDVNVSGDEALFEYTKKFDGFELNEKNIRVSWDEINEAYTRVDKEQIIALKYAYGNIEKFHKEQFNRLENWSIETEKGVKITEKVVRVDSAGLYVPGGRASYPSTVLMTSIPAKIAGVKRIVMVSPPPVSPLTLVSADICGVDEIYRVGGVQAIAALSYGTESIPRVDKIVGPGNIYVAAAKGLVQSRGIAGIDMPAGPSEVLIISDKTSNLGFMSADILAQAEHDPNARCCLVFIGNNPDTGERIEKEINAQLKDLNRKEIIKESLKNFILVLVKNVDEAVEFANHYAPEHLEIMAADAEKVVDKINNAGTIFVGSYSLVAAGDYASGANHVLPTSGASRFASELSVRDFLKTISVQTISKD